ncbi:MAG: DNA cytosine methyltransferase [Planctomycetes bacterium]|nr:DNA cytosine methyltransferase [Planctomycetota bacterium]
MGKAYYNEIDPYAAQWLRNLIDAGHIAPGVVDERSIVDVDPAELAQYTQCHFFAGIGGWAYALRLAGWPDDRPVWTGSCPCQPFSAAGARKGTDDERHLWPAFRWLIAKCRPATVFGEQVASDDGREWLTGVRADLEALDYIVGAADLCAAGAGAPHIRQRLWWVAHLSSARRPGTRQGAPGGQRADSDARRRFSIDEPASSGAVSDCGLADSIEPGLEGHAGHGDHGDQPERHATDPVGSTAASGATGVVLVDSESQRWQRGPHNGDEGRRERALGQTGPAGFWSAYDLVPCLDGKARRVEPGTFPLAHGVPARVGKLRAYGNAIVPEVAKVWIEACQEHVTII